MSLIGKNNNQSVLNDNASLFQIQKEKTEKQKWSELNAHQRLRYFLDYYFVKCLVCIVALILIISITWSALKPRNESMLSIAVVHNYLIPEEKEALKCQLEGLLIPKDNQEIKIDDAFPNGYESDAKLTAYMSTQEIDLIITDEDHFKELAKTGCFEDLDEFIPDFAKKHTENLCRTAGPTEIDLTDESAKVSSSVPQEDMKNDNIKAYGIRITNCKSFKNAWYADTEAVAGIVINSIQKENAVTALTELFFAG